MDKAYSIQIIDLFSYLAQKQEISVYYTASSPNPQSNRSPIRWVAGALFPKGETTAA